MAMRDANGRRNKLMKPEPALGGRHGRDQAEGDGDTGARGGDYEVGYGKPPRQYQFKPGQSGNPRGRKKGSRGLKTELHQVLSEPMTVQMNGHSYTASKQMIVLQSLLARAIKETAAARTVLDLILAIFGAEDRGGERERLSARDQALLDAMLQDWSEGPGRDG